MSLFPSTSTSLTDSATGQPKTIFDYDVIDYIGEADVSLIYAVSDPKTRQLYALKHVVRRTEKDLCFIEQLENEFEVGSDRRA